MQRFFITAVRKRTASDSAVPVDRGRKLISSRIIIRMWLRPFLGGMYFSTRSEKKMQPTLSLFWAAEKATTAAISVRMFFLRKWVDPNMREAETSTMSIIVSSRSSS